MESEFFRWFASDEFDGRFSQKSAKAGFKAGWQAARQSVTPGVDVEPWKVARDINNYLSSHGMDEIGMGYLTDAVDAALQPSVIIGWSELRDFIDAKIEEHDDNPEWNLDSYGERLATALLARIPQLAASKQEPKRNDDAEIVLESVGMTHDRYLVTVPKGKYPVCESVIDAGDSGRG